MASVPVTASQKSSLVTKAKLNSGSNIWTSPAVKPIASPVVKPVVKLVASNVAKPVVSTVDKSIDKSQMAAKVEKHVVKPTVPITLSVSTKKPTSQSTEELESDVTAREADPDGSPVPVEISQIRLNHIKPFYQFIKGVYSGQTNYALYDAVIEPGSRRIYVSLVQNNIGNDPSLTPYKWKSTQRCITVDNIIMNVSPIISVDSNVQHYALVDVELCDGLVGPVLSICIMHASYRKHHRHFHSYLQLGCFRHVREYTKSGLLWWAHKTRKKTHKILWLLGKLPNITLPKNMIEKFDQYKHFLEVSFPDITFLYDDVHADYVMLDNMLREHNLPCLRYDRTNPSRYRQWKCTRDIMRGAFRMVDKTSNSMEETDMYRRIRDRWNFYFEFDSKQNDTKDMTFVPIPVSTDTKSEAIDTKSKEKEMTKPTKNANNVVKTTKTQVKSESEFEIDPMYKIEHYPLFDVWNHYQLLFDVEDLRFVS
jgi:hypothetical protein